MYFSLSNEYPKNGKRREGEMGRRWTAVLVALSTCFLLVNGQLDWFVRKSELSKLQVETTEGERGYSVCACVCVMTCLPSSEHEARYTVLTDCL